MGRPDRHSERTPHTGDPGNESEITRDHGERAGKMSGTSRSQRSGHGRERDREQDDWKIHPHQDSPPEWDEEDRPDA
ncbi:hypothetical protein V1L54_03400 [Streptomyces sp. TRM 70361]|uniref:hypothetical protein n=1 Tax=Streptomyces sp. TRM 70361 TaxID=3116553 RepID=UPI002E7C043A|nr:hypothetical protein [Streptomyces sp. TRM 70361]MEE1938467.1 hypothetical protein [Streptomyces sp. TRM 70361]